MAAETTGAQCHAITADGERCDRPAGEDGFCHQHDEGDETVEGYGSDESSADGGGAESADAESEGSEGRTDGTTDDTGDSSGETAHGGSLEGVRDVRETVESLAPEIIGRELDAVIEVDGRDEGWQAVVEVVERPAVPDTQDILGRYEIDLADGAVTGYRRIDRYRRSDTGADEPR